ncbi:hypothetical protein QYE76_068720 [Lolium multiflorum]|uniref:Uncharacterized protein n=1 Tax=Lolium multiflorum TaxID=4521 RepID=A0AAD8WCV4_LOLMU|nr:hypothetical protein QYE76_068720 [Lolium multiflorum]
MASQADYPSLAHMVQKLSLYEQRHPELYQDKFKRAVVLVETEEDEGSAGDQEVAVAEWTRGSPVSCKWVKSQGPPRGFDFDVTKAEQIFDLLLKEKQLKVWRQQIQMAIEQGRLIFSQYAMKVDTHPFPAVNMVECTYPGRCQPGFSFSINMVGPGHHSGKDRDEGSRSRSKDKEEAVPRDRLRHDGKRYITEGEVKNWDGDEVEVIHADDSVEISTAGMNIWETAGQEPLSGITLDDCERIDVTKNGVRLVLSTGLTV